MATGDQHAAFLSYSRAADGRLAPALQQGLQRFAKPWNRQRALRVFRDDANLSANPALWSSIQDALDGSEYFILLASPEAAASPWVAREVEHWLATKPREKLLIAVTGGEIAWAAGDFDRAVTTSLPAPLFGAFAEEPRWVDLRELRRQDQLTLQLPTFRDKVADLAAPLHHLPKDELLGEDVRQFRRTRRLVRSAVAVLVLLTLVAIGAAGVAVVQRRDAVAQRQAAESARARAEEQQRAATARLLVATAETQRTSDPLLALRLGIAADRLAPNLEARPSLVGTLTATRYMHTIPAANQVGEVEFSPDRRTLAVGSESNLTLWDASDPTRPRQLGSSLTIRNAVLRGDAIAFSADGHLLAVCVRDTIVVYDATDPSRLTLRATIDNNDVDAYAVAFSPAGAMLAIGGQDQLTQLWSIADPAHPTRVGAPLAGNTDSITSLAFTADGGLLASGSDKAVDVWRVADPGHPTRAGTPMIARAPVAFSSTGLLATHDNARTENNAFVLWTLADPAHPVRLPVRLTGNDSSVAFSPDGQLAATAAYTRTATLWDISDPLHPAAIGGPFVGHTNFVVSVAFSPDGNSLVTGSTDKTAIVWSVANGGRAAPRSSALSHVDGFAYRTDGTGVAVGTVDGVVHLYDLRDQNRPVDHTTAITGARGADLFDNGQILATDHTDGTVSLWDVTTAGEPTRRGVTLTANGILGGMTPDGHTAISVNQDGATLWDLTDPDHPARRGPTLNELQYGATVLAFSPDNRILAAANIFDTKAVLWDLRDTTATGHQFAELPVGNNFVSAMAFAPDGRSLAMGRGDGSTVLWDVRDPTRPAVPGAPMAGPTDEQGSASALSSNSAVFAVTFASDGHTVATTHPDHTVILWDITGSLRAYQLGPPLTGPTGAAFSATFAPDGRALATTSTDGTLIRWDLTGLQDLRDHAPERACAITGRGLNRDEWSHYVGDGLDFRETCAA